MLYRQECRLRNSSSCSGVIPPDAIDQRYAKHNVGIFTIISKHLKSRSWDVKFP